MVNLKIMGELTFKEIALVLKNHRVPWPGSTELLWKN